MTIIAAGRDATSVVMQPQLGRDAAGGTVLPKGSNHILKFGGLHLPDTHPNHRRRWARSPRASTPTSTVHEWPLGCETGPRAQVPACEWVSRWGVFTPPFQ